MARQLGLSGALGARRNRIGSAFVCMICGCALVYALLFATGSLLRGESTTALVLAAVAGALGMVCYGGWRRAMPAESSVENIGLPENAL